MCGQYLKYDSVVSESTERENWNSKTIKCDQSVLNLHQTLYFTVQTCNFFLGHHLVAWQPMHPKALGWHSVCVFLVVCVCVCACEHVHILFFKSMC